MEEITQGDCAEEKAEQAQAGLWGEQTGQDMEEVREGRRPRESAVQNRRLLRKQCFWSGFCVRPAQYWRAGGDLGGAPGSAHWRQGCCDYPPSLDLLPQ